MYPDRPISSENGENFGQAEQKTLLKVSEYEKSNLTD